MAQDMIKKINANEKADITEICNIPVRTFILKLNHQNCQPEMTKLSKNKKKKLRKRKKKQRELLEKQLYEIEGLDVSVNANLAQAAEQNIASKIPDSILNEKIAPIPRVGVKAPPVNNSNGVEKDHEPIEVTANDENGVKKKKKKVKIYGS